MATNMSSEFGVLILGAGVAKQARDRFNGLERLLGEKLKEHGNRTQHLKQLHSFSSLVEDAHLWAFPTKITWEKPSTIERISKSACQLKLFWSLAKHIIPEKEPPLVALPRPGCVHGKLNWKMVKPVIAPILDNDSFIILRPAYTK